MVGVLRQYIRKKESKDKKREAKEARHNGLLIALNKVSFALTDFFLPSLKPAVLLFIVRKLWLLLPIVKKRSEVVISDVVLS